MRVIDVSDIGQFDDGEVIPSLRGKITQTYERKTGSKDGKPWSVQNAMFQDATGKIRFSVWGHEDIKPWTGKEVTLSAHKSDKGLTGLFAEDNTYKEKTTRQIRMTASGKIELADTLTGTTNKLESTKPETRVELDSGDAVKDAKRSAMQAANAFEIALGASKYVRTQYDLEYGENSMTDEQFQAITSSIFISLDRKGFVDKLPKAPLEPQKPKQEQQPAPSKDEEPPDADW